MQNDFKTVQLVLITDFFVSLARKKEINNENEISKNFEHRLSAKLLFYHHTIPHFDNPCIPTQFNHFYKHAESKTEKRGSERGKQRRGSDSKVTNLKSSIERSQSRSGKWLQWWVRLFWKRNQSVDELVSSSDRACMSSIYWINNSSFLTKLVWISLTSGD